MENQLVEGIKAEFRIRVFEESFRRIRKCLSMIGGDDLWKKPNPQITSIGSSVLHIDGNARQWIGSISGQPFNRERDLEFQPDTKFEKIKLETLLDQLEKDLDHMLNAIGKENLINHYTIQGFHVSGLSVIVHVIEHVSYHTGQITLMTKLFTNEDTGYFDGYDLNE